MSALSNKEQQLFNAARNALPAWMFSDDQNPQELIGAFAKQFGQTWTQIDLWCNQIFITRAFGLWLDQHARDSGTRRQTGESDATLAARLRNVEDRVIRSSLLNVANVLLASAGLGPAHMIELRRDHAYFHPQGNAKRTFFSRGWRMAGPGETTIIIQLPYTTSAAVSAAIQAALLQKKAGGVIVSVEIRANP